MVDAGIARKVDFGEGRFRFEHSYRHPRHFHLICKSCNRSFEFLSSDIEALLEEVAAARNFTARQSVLQIHGTCEACRTGRPAARRGRHDRAALRARRAAHRDRDRAQRPRVLFARGAASRATRAAAACSRSWPRRRRNTSARSRRATASCCSRIRSSSRGRRSSSSRGPPTGCSPPAPSSSTNGVDDRQALMIGIRCERGSHRFFKRYGERFEDSEGKKIFLEFADEERDAPRAADSRVPVARRAPAARPRPSRASAEDPPRASACHASVIDLHLHTTASDGRLAPAGPRRARGGARPDDHQRHRSRHVGGLAEAARRPRAPALRLVERHRDHGGRGRPRRAHARLFLRSGRTRRWRAFLDAQRADRIAPCARDRATGWRRSAIADRRRARCSHGRGARRPEHRPPADRRRAGRGRARRDRNDAFDRLLGDGAAGVRAAPRPHARRGHRRSSGRRRHRVAGASRADADRRHHSGAGGGRTRRARGAPQRSRRRRPSSAIARWRATLGLAVSGGSDFHGDSGHRAASLGAVTLARRGLCGARSAWLGMSRARDSRRSRSRASARTTAACGRCASSR